MKPKIRVPAINAKKVEFGQYQGEKKVNAFLFSKLLYWFVENYTQPNKTSLSKVYTVNNTLQILMSSVVHEFSHA